MFLPVNTTRVGNIAIGYRTLDGQNVQKKDFGSISEASEFVRTHQDIENFKFYGNTSYLYTWINDTFPGRVEYDTSLINVIYLDIEVASDQGVPDFRNPTNPITAITIAKRGKKITFGCGKYKPKSPNVMYCPCKDEKHLLKCFLTVWTRPDYAPDVLTGWYVEFFDIPYLYNRIKLLLGKEMADKMSPWGIVDEVDVGYKTQDSIVYHLRGISVLDYLVLYKKFSYANQESYSLDYIASVELGEGKVDFSEYDSLQTLYKENYEKFIDYNIRDVELVEKLDDKLKLIEQVYTLAYDAKVNYSDTLASVRMWDTIIHNYLLEQYIVVPPQTKKVKKSMIIGAYVKDPKVGLHNWVVSYDLTSLYPHLIIQYNISPETFVAKDKANFTIDDVVGGRLSEFSEKWGDKVCCTANLCYYRKDRQGFLGALMEKIYKDRFIYKQKMIEAKKEYEKTKDPELLKKIAQYEYLQMAKKIQLNSGYGVVANPHFRFYDRDNAEAVTTSGQLAVRWVADRINRYFNKALKTEGKDYVIASDTDSIYISFESFVGKNWGSDETIVKALDAYCNSRVSPFIEKCFERLAEYTNAYKPCLTMKREVIASKGIWTAKKRYILNVWDSEGIRYEEPRLKISGIESVRSSTPSSCRENIKKVLKVIMNEDQAALIRFIEEFHEEFKNLPVNEVSFPRGISKMGEYTNKESPSDIYMKACPIQIKGALIYNHLVTQHKLDKTHRFIYNGDKIKFAYLKTPNPIHQSVIAFIDVIPKQFKIGDYIDYEKQFEKGFLDPVRTVVEAIGWSFEEKHTLEEFME